MRNAFLTLSKVDTVTNITSHDHYAVVRRQSAVSAYLYCRKILFFGFTRQYRLVYVYNQETIRRCPVSLTDSTANTWTVGGLFGANFDYERGRLTYVLNI